MDTNPDVLSFEPKEPAPTTAEAFRPHPIRGPFNALFFTALNRYLDHVLRPHKQALFDNLPATVVELGPGVGANLRYLRAGTRLIAVEPNPALHDRLRARADRAHIDLELHTTGAERLDLTDESVDAVISSLVLCTVTDPVAVLTEVHRVLRPGGHYAFLEHVAAPDGTALRCLQRTARRPWSWTFEGCSCERDLQAVIEAAGFAETTIEAYRLRSPFLPVNPQIAGIARKRS
ncbi:class I SAM-dependent methyltransferase [Rhodococcus sp. ACT016]|uniref:class I SAM-dependent methyltransferase n=1 Tax=Rhodococcus sp. ACT016 TaxID=3134808 RepID=UPI003D26D566